MCECVYVEGYSLGVRGGIGEGGYHMHTCMKGIVQCNVGGVVFFKPWCAVGSLPGQVCLCGALVAPGITTLPLWPCVV